jgi:hypothetical protein
MREIWFWCAFACVCFWEHAAFQVIEYTTSDLLILYVPYLVGIGE